MSAAQLPPSGLPGLRPEWSRMVEAPDHAGVVRTWHILDTGARPQQRLTILCVHGNPTWSYLWREILEQAPADVRVIAVDQLDMGYSERTGRIRRLRDRISDLDLLTAAIGLQGPVAVIAHDWGGPIALGWAQRNSQAVASIALLNTAVHQPASSTAPAIIRAVRMGAALDLLTRRTPVFVRGTSGLSRLRRGRRMPREVAAAFAAPYATAERRAAVRDFVADIPLDSDHPSMRALEGVAAGLSDVQVPVLLMWGPDDPVFTDVHLDDLRRRMPHADVHRYEGARHLVLEDAPTAVSDLLAWIDAPRRSQDRGPFVDGPEVAITDALVRRAGDHGDAVVDMGTQGTLTWAQLHGDVTSLAAGLRNRGVAPGDRVALLVPPSPELVSIVYACWSIGAVVVVADAGLGVRGMRRALRGACPDHVIGIARGLALAKTLRIPGLSILVGAAGRAGRFLGDSTLAQVRAEGEGCSLPEPPDPRDDAIVVFTSGATGPSKGVVYTHGRLCALRDTLIEHYRITSDDALVGAFAPWIVLGPALGIASVIPAMDITAAETLTASALSDAVAGVRGTLVWASPAALRGVAGTAEELTPAQIDQMSSLRLILGAGAPVPVDVLRAVAALAPAAEARTPYGMTEALPVSDVALAELDAASGGEGVLVGCAVSGVDIAIAPLDALGVPARNTTTEADITGEIVIRAAHAKDRYDGLWVTEHASAQPEGCHRTGDVGHLDASGRLWVEGRLAHVIATAGGPVTPVGPEQRVARVPHVSAAACVGIGPRGTQQIVVVVVAPARKGIAPMSLTDRVREVAGVPVAAVLVTDTLPVDIRHHSKVDRTALSRWAERVLAGTGH